jgi:hypothetical protein
MGLKIIYHHNAKDMISLHVSLLYISLEFMIHVIARENKEDLAPAGSKKDNPS